MVKFTILCALYYKDIHGYDISTEFNEIVIKNQDYYYLSLKERYKYDFG